MGGDRSFQAARREVQNCTDLFRLKTIISFDQLVDSHSGIKTIKHKGDRHSRAAKDPSSVKFSRHTLNRRAA